MKSTLLITALLAFVSQVQASVTINLGMAELWRNSGANLVAFEDARVNIFAKTSGTWGTDLASIASEFATLTSTFTPAGASLINQFRINNTGQVGPEQLDFTLTGGLTDGQELLAVIYPTLNIDNFSSPGQGTVGFVYRTSQVIDDSDIAWVIPADGSTVTLNALTISVGGSLSDVTLSPDGPGGFTTVPEPSTYALMAIALTGGWLSSGRRKVQA